MGYLAPRALLVARCPWPLVCRPLQYARSEVQNCAVGCEKIGWWNAEKTRGIACRRPAVAPSLNIGRTGKPGRILTFETG